MTKKIDSTGYIPPKLPLPMELETKTVLKKAIEANNAIGELKGVAKIIPKQEILINFFALQEAKSSSEIENIHTTIDELIGLKDYVNKDDNEKVLRYVDAIKNSSKECCAGDRWKSRLILTNDIIKINAQILGHDSGYRKQLGTKIENNTTGEILHTPPQNYQDIADCMDNLIEYINTKTDIDPLIKMAMIHYQFEVIHPFYDGNGRTGRILNILYLVKTKKLTWPILYLSGYIHKNKNKYYELLQSTRLTQNFEPWILYILKGIADVSIKTIKVIRDINSLMLDVKQIMRDRKINYYSKDLIEFIFSDSFITLNDLVTSLNISRQTASKYLDGLVDLKIMSVVKKNGVESKYYNIKLIKLLSKNIV